MSKKIFSTGFPRLDEYVGGIFPGDSLIAFLSNPDSWIEIIKGVESYASREKIVINYLSFDGSLSGALDSCEKLSLIELFPTVSRKTSAPISFRKIRSSLKPHSYLIIDDLSKWARTTGSKRQMFALFAWLLAESSRLKSVLLCSCVRSAFELDELARLKDSVTVCLDLVRHDNEVYFLPLSLRGRYQFHGVAPLAMRKLAAARPLVQPTEGQPPGIDSARFLKMTAELASDEKYLTMFREAGEAMFLFDFAGDYREVNRQTELLLGYSADELRTIQPGVLVHRDDRRKMLRFLAQIKRKKRGSVLLSLLTKKGISLPVEVRASVVKDSLCFASILDVSERQRVEQTLRQSEGEYRELVNHSLFPILIASKSKLLFGNDAFMRSFGLDSLNDLHERDLKQFFSPHGGQGLQKLLRQPSLPPESQPLDMECLRSDGSTFLSRVTISDISYQGKPCRQFTFCDVSDLRGIVDRLSHSEQRYRSLVDASPDAIAVIREGRIEYCNSALRMMYGYGSDEEVTGKASTTLLSEGDSHRMTELEQKRLAKGKPSVLQSQGVRHGGEQFDVEIVGVHVGLMLLVFLRDVTQQVRSERDLRQYVSEVKLLEEILSAVDDADDTRKIASSSLQKVMGTFGWDMGVFYLPQEERLSLSFHRGFPEDLLKKLSDLSLDEGIGGLVSKTHEPQSFLLDKYPSYLPYRSLFRAAGIKEICFLPLIYEETLIGMMMLGTKKHRAKRDDSMRLLHSIGTHLGASMGRAAQRRRVGNAAERHLQLIESVSEVLYIASPDGKMTYLNPVVERLTGYSSKEFARNTSLWLRLVHPDDKRVLLERVANLGAVGDRGMNEYRLLPKGKAMYRWVRDSFTIMKNDRGEVQSVFGLLTDITPFKLLMDEMRRSDEFKTNILASIQEGVAVFDDNLRCVHWNSALERTTGLRHDDVVTQPAEDIFARCSVKGIEKLLREALAGRLVNSDDLHFENPISRTEGFIWGQFAPLVDASGKTGGVVGIVADISDRKRLENQIRESEQVLRNVIDTMSDVLVLTDLKGVVLQVNRTFLQLLGYSRAEAIGCDVLYPWLVDEQMGRYVLWLSTLREKNWLHDFDMTWKAKDGRLIPMSVSTTLLRNSVGGPIAIVNIARDITERAKLARDLEGRNRQIEFINRIITEANRALDFDEIFATISREVNKMVPFDEIGVGLLSEDSTMVSVYAHHGPKPMARGTLIPLERTVSQFAIQQKQPVIVSDFESQSRYRNFLSFHQGLRSQISLPIYLKGRVLGTLDVGSKEPHAFADDHIPVLELLSQQIGSIIDRVQLFQQVKEDAAYIHNLLDSIDSIVYTVDTHCDIRESNKAWHEFMRESGAPPTKDYHGKNLFDVLPNDSLKVTFQNVVDQLLKGTVRFFSQEFVDENSRQHRVFQLTINPMIIGRQITGLVFTHTDITILKRTEGELKKSNEQLLALNKISTLISTSLDLAEILETTVPLLKSLIGAAVTAVYLVDVSSRDLVLVSLHGYARNDVPFVARLHSTESATGVVVKTRQPLYVGEKAYHDERIQQRNREFLQRVSIEAMAAIPLLSKDKVLGALDIFYSTPHEFSASEQQVMTLIGNQLGAAIENANLYRETVQKSLEIEQRNKELDDFTYVVSHDLKEPLISIEGFSKILQADYQDVIQGEGKEYLESIVGASTRMKGLIDDLLMLSRVSRPSESFKNCSMQKVVDDIRTDMEFTIRQRNVQFVIPEPLPEVYGNQAQMTVVFRNLLGNAIKFNTNVSPIVEIGFRIAENNCYLFSVKDNGIGIDKDFHTKVFTIFQRLHRREQYEGTGAGLAIVKKIIELHKGRIWVESELGRGSTFYFTLPVARGKDSEERL